MNAAFYFDGYVFETNSRRRFLLTVKDGPHDRYEVAKELLIEAYPDVSVHSWSGVFICRTPDEFWREV